MTVTMGTATTQSEINHGSEWSTTTSSAPASPMYVQRTVSREGLVIVELVNPSASSKQMSSLHCPPAIKPASRSTDPTQSTPNRLKAFRAGLPSVETSFTI